MTDLNEMFAAGILLGLIVGFVFGYAWHCSEGRARSRQP